MTKIELHEFLLTKADQFESLSFIEDDPISIPHQFKLKEDIEIIGLLVATIAWGNRKSIIKSGNRMMDFMDNDPYAFVMNHKDEDLKALDNFVHRTFNSDDFKHFIKALKHIYINKGGLENIFILV